MLNLAEKKQARLGLVRALDSDSRPAPQPTSLPAALQPAALQPATAEVANAEVANARHTKVRQEVSAANALIEHLAHLGVEEAFGVSGGAIALLYDALATGPIALRHFRHESGAAFAAAEASFASNKPTAVFATTGPGLLNALTGLTAARWDGAKVVLISGATSSAQRGRWATQETSAYTLPHDVLFAKGPIFDFAVKMEAVSEFPQVMRRLAQGLAKPGGFVAHVCLPMAVQSARVGLDLGDKSFSAAIPCVSANEIARIARLLQSGSFAIWAGFGARGAAKRVLELAGRAGAKVFCSPRAKGVIPENHPDYLGVTGLGGHSAVTDFMNEQRPDRVLVLGTRLGEATSFWDRDMVPSEGFVHVDLDPEVPGAAFPEARTVAVQAEINEFLALLLPHFKKRGASFAKALLDEPLLLPLQGRTPVRPQVLMNAIQRRFINGSDALIMAECGNAFAWCNHYLRFPSAERYRVSTLFGSMGHMASGVVGAALARGGKAVAVLGDGSMLMNSEISSAVQYNAPAVWVVLNDSGYGMCRDGQKALGLSNTGVAIPTVDFARLAQSQGADGVVVEREGDLDAALSKALAAEGPFVVDVRVDPDEASPLLKRFESLIKQGSSKNVAGWERR